MKKLWRRNGLTFVLALFFLHLWLVGQFLTGRAEYNDRRAERGLPAVSAMQYATSPHFWEATMENWESEFFQMFVFVVATAYLFQKGSAESNDPDAPPAKGPPLSKQSPWAARRGGWVRTLYSHSLSLALFLLFLISFVLHAASGTRLLNEEEQAKGLAPIGIIDYMGGSRFWFESFQNWQSEFLAIGLMVVLTIHLREKGSAQSKPVNMPHHEQE